MSTLAAPPSTRTWGSARSRAAVLGLVAGLTVLALVLRLAGIGDKSLWIDESFSQWIATRPLAQLWRDTAVIDTHPPLYYTLLHFWIDPASGEADLRGPSALWGAATVPVLYLVGREVGGRPLGLLTALLQAVSPLHVWYGQQARMYTMLTFFVAVAMFCMLRLLATGGPRARPLGAVAALLCWVGVVGSMVLAMLSHNTAVLLTASVVVFVGVLGVLRGSADRRWSADPDRTVRLAGLGRPAGDLLHWVAALVAVGVLWLAWLPGFLLQSSRVDAEFWIAPPTSATVLEHWRNLVSAQSPELLLVPILLLSLVLAGLGGWRLRHRPEVLVLLLLLLLGPPVGELLVSLRRPIFYSQTLIWTSLPLTVLMGAGVLALRRRALVAGAVALMLALNLVSLVSYHRSPGIEDWRGAAAYLASRVGPGDVVLFSAGWTEIPFRYYYDRGDGPPIETHGLPVDPFERDVLEPKMADSDVPRLDGLIAGRPKVWLVLSHDSYTDPTRIVTGRIGESMTVAEQQDLAAMRIQSYVPR